jgi:hypothetical protein
MIEDLADYMTDVAVELRKQGGATEAVLHDWAAPGHMPTAGERGGGLVDAEPDFTLAQRREAAEAGRLQKEWRTRTRRILADLHWLEQTMQTANPPETTRLRFSDLSAAQVAAEGYCVSCIRAGVNTVTAKGRYRDRCRFCGEWEAEHKKDPPVALVELRASGQTMTTKSVAVALTAGRGR